jgi:putative transposase
MSGTNSQDDYFIRERKHRLPDEAYKGFAITAYTICIQNRINAFTDPVLFKTFESHLRNALHKYSVNALVYLFMPDHCHLLLQGVDRSSNSRKSVTLFKQTTGFWLSKNLPSITWQKDFYDHVLRKDDDLNKQIRYILLNPVRKDLSDVGMNIPLEGLPYLTCSRGQMKRACSNQHSRRLKPAPTATNAP